MKIDSSTKSVGNVAGSATARPTGGATASSAEKGVSPAPSDVELSGVANHLQQVGELGAADQVFDAKKVAEIQQAIAEGRFKVNPERIADGLLDSVRDLLSQRRPA